MSILDLPVTRYARSGELNIAYQTMGNGPVDLMFVPGLTTHVEFLHEIPGYTDFLRRVAAFARVVTFDKSGQGLSDRAFGVPSLEQRMDDIRAMMDDIGSTGVALLLGSILFWWLPRTPPLGWMLSGAGILLLFVFYKSAMPHIRRLSESTARAAELTDTENKGDLTSNAHLNQVLQDFITAANEALKRLSA